MNTDYYKNMFVKTLKKKSVKICENLCQRSFMRNSKRQSGMTLTELLVVVAIMAVLLGISVPTAQHLKESFESSTSVRHLINAALGNARAMAVREQTYVGVRFQQDAEGNSYMIFIVQDKEATGLAYGFRAVMGRKPMQLPEDVGVLANVFSPGNTDAQNDALIDESFEWRNANTFSIVFSPAGKLVTHPVRARNMDGLTEGDLPQLSNDTIFNTKPVVDLPNKKAMFCQDDYFAGNTQGYPDLGLGEETSVQDLILYSKKELNAVSATARWSGYFSILKTDFISPYTGELIFE